MKHPPDESKQAFKKLPKATREITAFFYLVIDKTIENFHTSYTPTGIRCFKKNCEGIIWSEIDDNGTDINRKCSACGKSGND
jgi:hypothetical protein